MIESIYTAKDQTRAARIAAHGLIAELEEAVRVLEVIEAELRLAGSEVTRHNCRTATGHVYTAMSETRSLTVPEFTRYHTRLAKVMEALVTLDSEIQ